MTISKRQHLLFQAAIYLQAKGYAWKMLLRFPSFRDLEQVCAMVKTHDAAKRDDSLTPRIDAREHGADTGESVPWNVLNCAGSESGN